MFVPGTACANGARRRTVLCVRNLHNGEWVMLETIVVILLILWALGLFAFNVGNLIHILLVIAIIVILVRVIQGRRPL